MVFGGEELEANVQLEKPLPDVEVDIENPGGFLRVEGEDGKT